MIKNSLSYLFGSILVLLVGCSAEQKDVQAATSKPKTVLDKFCADCHAPPDPSVHKADEWKNVVYRMQNHRIKRAYGELTEEEFSSVVKYLSDRAS